MVQGSTNREREGESLAIARQVETTRRTNARENIMRDEDIENTAAPHSNSVAGKTTILTEATEVVAVAACSSNEEMVHL